MYASKSESAQGPQAISNLFNKYFIEIGVNLASTIETLAIIDGKFNATSLIQSSCNSFFLEQIVEEKVVNYIRAMNQRWSREHKARGQGQGQGHKKNPRPRPRTAFPRTEPLEAKAKDQGHKRKCSPKKKGLHKNFSSDLHKKTFSKKFSKRSTKF